MLELERIFEINKNNFFISYVKTKDEEKFLKAERIVLPRMTWDCHMGLLVLVLSFSYGITVPYSK